MKRRKTLLENEEKIFSSSYLNIINVGDQMIFEIQQHTTNDLAEAVALMMKNGAHDEEFWKLPTSIFSKDIQSERSLYWLSGGDSEWVFLDNYSDSWYNYCTDFCNRWGSLVMDSIEKSDTLSDIRDSFKKNLNLLAIYDWAIGRGFIR